MSVWREIKELNMYVYVCVCVCVCVCIYIYIYIYIYKMQIIYRYYDLLLWVRALFESVSPERLLDITNYTYQTIAL